MDVSTIGVRKVSSCKLYWKAYAETLQHPFEIGRPTNSDNRGASRIFEHKIPADDPGEDFTERQIGIGIGASGDWDQCGELCIAQRNEGAGEARKREGQHHAGPRKFRRDGAGKYEDACADNPADAQREQRNPAERALEAIAFVLM